MIRTGGQIGPFVRIAVTVVEFLVTVGIVNIAPAFCAESVATRLSKVCHRDMRPVGLWIFQQGDKAGAVVVRFRCKAGEFGECRV